MALYPTKLTGKSNVAFHSKGGSKFIHKWVELKDIAANATFVLPAFVMLTGRVVVANTSAATQAAITIGTAPGGTQVTGGFSLGAGLPQYINGTSQTPTGADRTIYVESAAWQAGVHVYLEAWELPMVDDRNAKG